MRVPRSRSSILLGLALLTTSGGPGRARAGDSDGFDAGVATILARRCLDCHSGPDPKGKLDLSRRASAFAGGEDGPAIVAGKPDESPLWERVMAGEMPPKSALPEAEKAAIRDWIAAGAAWGTDPIDGFRLTTARRAGRDWWSLRPVIRPEIPAVRDPGRARSPIDAFVLAKLDASNLSPAPEADRRALIRRLSFDLTGLPPEPEEVDAFLADPSPIAYENLVDRRLASPQYGVRWARWWLDLARFGESHGFEFDEFRPDAWRYRDWVVEALNRDMPYDEFARLQLAGDVLRPDDPGAVEATGFLVAGAYDTVGQTQISQVMRAAVRAEEVEDVIAAVGQAFLGLTVHCARCHDHKFDPIRQAEYYRLASALDGVRQGERDLSGIDPGIVADRRRIDALDRRISAIEAPAREKPRAGHAKAADPGRVVPPDAIAEALPPDLRDERARLLAEVATLRASQSGRSHKAYAVTPRPAGTMRVHLRGNPNQPGDPASAGGVAAVGGIESDFRLPPDAPEADRRRALAAWITHPDNPLFARVVANRLWQAHFGSGLVETPSDLGFNGGRPSHPELLDWLASEVRARGWSLKAIHRQIVTSATYRRSSRPDPAALARDAGDRLLWRKAPARLEAEMVRDAMLAASGRLDPRLGGPSFLDHAITKPKGSASVLYVAVPPDAPGLDRRTLYRAWSRGGRSTLLDAFDCPDPSATAPKRPVTTTPLQALAMMNNALVLHLAGALADRLAREAGPDSGKQVDHAYRLAFGRLPQPDERAEAVRVVGRHGAAPLARALFNSGEFLYLD